jgi:hypothetical protein
MTVVADIDVVKEQDKYLARMNYSTGSGKIFRMNHSHPVARFGDKLP